MTVGCAPTARNTGREPGPRGADRFVQRPREREPDRDTRRDRASHSGADEHDRETGDRKPRDADGLAQAFPSTCGARDFDGARRRLRAERNHTPATGRSDLVATPRLVGDSVNRLGEPQSQRCMRSNGQPPLRQTRQRRAQRQALRPAVSKRPTEQGRPAHDDHDRDRFARRKQCPGQQPATADRKRDPSAVGPKSPRRDERPAERLHLDPRERHGVRRQRRPRPPDHGRHQPQRNGCSQCGEHPDRPAAAPPPPTVDVPPHRS